MASTSTNLTGTDAATAYYTSLDLTEVLEDLSIRFIVNLPSEELSSIERIGFQVEQAHWFYEDFLRPLNPSLPSYPLRRFSSLLLRTASQTVPLIEQYITGSASKGTDELEEAFDDFMKYKTRVPVCGAAIVNKTWDKVLLVKGWKSSASWGFPKGKINQSESPVNCAIREVWEETGFDCTGLVSEAPKDSLEINMREQKVRLFFVKGVDEEKTVFEAKARKEISKIAWFPLNELPTWKTSKSANNGQNHSNSDLRKFYLVSPFVGKLKQWVREERERERRAGKGGATTASTTVSASAALPADVPSSVQPQQHQQKQKQKQAIPTAPAAMRDAKKNGFEGVPSGPSAERNKTQAQVVQQAQPSSQPPGQQQQAQIQAQAQTGIPTFPDTSALWALLGGGGRGAGGAGEVSDATTEKPSHEQGHQAVSYASAAGGGGSTSSWEEREQEKQQRDAGQSLLQTLMGGATKQGPTAFEQGASTSATATASSSSNLAEDVLSRSVGAHFIREQGDERGRELLSLISSGGQRDDVGVGKEMREGEQKLLGLLNGGATSRTRQEEVGSTRHQLAEVGKAGSMPTATTTGMVTKEDLLLGFLNGASGDRQLQAQQPAQQQQQVQPWSQTHTHSHEMDQGFQQLLDLLGHSSVQQQQQPTQQQAVPVPSSEPLHQTTRHHQLTTSSASPWATIAPPPPQIAAGPSMVNQHGPLADMGVHTSHRTESPLPAPRAKQVADLRGMLNMAGTTVLGGGKGGLGPGEDGTQRDDAPAPGLGTGSAAKSLKREAEGEERRKQSQREMVLRNMLALSGAGGGAGGIGGGGEEVGFGFGQRPNEDGGRASRAQAQDLKGPTQVGSGSASASTSLLDVLNGRSGGIVNGSSSSPAPLHAQLNAHQHQHQQPQHSGYAAPPALPLASASTSASGGYYQPPQQHQEQAQPPSSGPASLLSLINGSSSSTSPIAHKANDGAIDANLNGIVGAGWGDVLGHAQAQHQGQGQGQGQAPVFFAGSPFPSHPQPQPQPQQQQQQQQQQQFKTQEQKLLSLLGSPSKSQPAQETLPHPAPPQPSLHQPLSWIASSKLHHHHHHQPQPGAPFAHLQGAQPQDQMQHSAFAHPVGPRNFGAGLDPGPLSLHQQPIAWPSLGYGQEQSLGQGQGQGQDQGQGQGQHASQQDAAALEALLRGMALR